MIPEGSDASFYEHTKKMEKVKSIVFLHEYYDLRSLALIIQNSSTRSISNEQCPRVKWTDRLSLQL